MALKYSSQAAWLSDVAKLEPGNMVGFFTKDGGRWQDIEDAFSKQFKGRVDLKLGSHGSWVYVTRNE